MQRAYFEVMTRDKTKDQLEKEEKKAIDKHKIRKIEKV